MHADRFAARIADAHDAAGVAINGAVYLSQDADGRVLGHELVHAVQQTRSGRPAPEADLEREAARVAGGERGGIQLAAPSGAILLHPAYGVLRRAGRWLIRRSQRTISKHIARHGRQISGRSIHTVFRIPRKIRSYVRRALDDAQALARAATRHGPDDVLTGPGIRVTRQATRTPGKFRVVVDREFRSAIGTQGERVLRVIIDQSGRLVTAFPMDRLLTLGLGTAALTAFSTATAEAAEHIHAGIEAGTREPERDWITWLIDILVAPSVANEGERLWLFVRDAMRETTQRVIAEIEETEQMCLGPEERQAIEDLVAAAIGTPMLLEDESMWDDTEE